MISSLITGSESQFPWLTGFPQWLDPKTLKDDFAVRVNGNLFPSVSHEKHLVPFFSGDGSSNPLTPMSINGMYADSVVHFNDEGALLDIDCPNLRGTPTPFHQTGMPKPPFRKASNLASEVKRFIKSQVKGFEDWNHEWPDELELMIADDNSRWMRGVPLDMFSMMRGSIPERLNPATKFMGYPSDSEASELSFYSRIGLMYNGSFTPVVLEEGCFNMNRNKIVTVLNVLAKEGDAIVCNIASFNPYSYAENWFSNNSVASDKLKFSSWIRKNPIMVIHKNAIKKKHMDGSDPGSLKIKYREPKVGDWLAITHRLSHDPMGFSDPTNMTFTPGLRAVHGENGIYDILPQGDWGCFLVNPHEIPPIGPDDERTFLRQGFDAYQFETGVQLYNMINHKDPPSPTKGGVEWVPTWNDSRKPIEVNLARSQPICYTDEIRCSSCNQRIIVKLAKSNRRDEIPCPVPKCKGLADIRHLKANAEIQTVFPLKTLNRGYSK